MSAKPDPKKVLDEAMKLDPTARAFVAETLLESLDLDPDFTVSSEWQEEIRRRCADIDSGKVTLLDGALVINELREKYSR
jgi:Putative addiction module component